MNQSQSPNIWQLILGSGIIAAIIGTAFSNYGIQKNSICEAKVSLADEIMDLADDVRTLAITGIGVPNICYKYTGKIDISSLTARSLTRNEQIDFAEGFKQFSKSNAKLGSKAGFLISLLNNDEIPQKNLSGSTVLLGELVGYGQAIEDLIGICTTDQVDAKYHTAWKNVQIAYVNFRNEIIGLVSHCVHVKNPIIQWGIFAALFAAIELVLFVILYLAYRWKTKNKITFAEFLRAAFKIS